jgi:hypothetical protein
MVSALAVLGECRNHSTILVVVDEATSPSQPGTRGLVHYGKFFTATRLDRSLLGNSYHDDSKIQDSWFYDH